MVVSHHGDLFVLGGHRLLVGDARETESFACLMQDETAAMGFHDPPYNVKVAGHVGGRGRTKHREFACASGEMTSNQFIEFLERPLSLTAQYSVDGAIHYVCMDWRHTGELFTAGAVAYTELKNICVWVKNNVGQGSFYRSAHEFVFDFKHGTAPHLNTFELGQHGRMRSNVWHYAGVNSFRAGRMDDLKAHPTVKPLALVVDAMRDCSRRGDIVLDAFAGSGTTIMAGEQIGRRAFCMEIDPIYADVCISRWQAYTKRDAVLASTGETFDQLASRRVADATSAHADRRSVSRKGATPRSPTERRPQPGERTSAAASRRGVGKPAVKSKLVQRRKPQ
jgi:DNA modification methylase